MDGVDVVPGGAEEEEEEEEPLGPGSPAEATTRAFYPMLVFASSLRVRYRPASIGGGGVCKVCVWGGRG